MFKSILVPLDGSDHARKAARLAVDLATKYGAHVTFLTVTRKFKMSGRARQFLELENLRGEPQYLLDEMTKSIMEEARRYAREQGLKDFETQIVEGQPARTIVDHAKRRKNDLIMMGSRGLGDFKGMLLGSVSQKVVTLAPCTVTTVK